MAMILLVFAVLEMIGIKSARMLPLNLSSFSWGLSIGVTKRWLERWIS